MIFWKTKSRQCKDAEIEATSQAIKKSTEEIHAQSKFVQDALDEFMDAMLERKTEGTRK